MNIKNFTADTSSIILLSKAGIMDLFSSLYNIITTKSAINEFLKLESEQKWFNNIEISSLNSITDKDIINLWQDNLNSALLSDDLKMLNIAVKKQKPHISAIVVPYILKYHKFFSDSEFNQSIEILYKIGYYNKKVIEKSKLFGNNIPQWMKHIDLKK